MANFDQGKALRKLMLGIKVERLLSTHLAATTPYFHVYTGRVLLTGLVGLITTAAGANACSWVHTPTTGTAQPVCAALDINPALVGDLLTITGVGSANMVYNASLVGLPMLGTKVLLAIGNLSFIAAAADGATSWTLFYIPIDDGAYVLAV